MGRGNEAVSRPQGRDLPSLPPEFREALRSGCDRLRGAQARHFPHPHSHTLELIQLMKRENCKIILVEPYFDLKTPQSIARETGAQVVVYLPSVGGVKEVTTYFQLFDYDIALLTKAFPATQ